MIKVKHLTKKYDDKKVVDDVHFELVKGKITSFIGPNGAGKSTVLGMISRLILHDEGEVKIEDKLIHEWKSSELAKKLAILKQSNNLNLKLTVRELVEFGRFPHSKGRLSKLDEDKVTEAIAYMALDEFSDRYLDTLSGGQRQRAYIAMVIAQDTEYILLDEPLNNLDMKHSTLMMQTLRRLCDELNKTIILVMHDINFTSCYSDYIVALKNGKIVKYGTTNEVIQKEILEEIYEMDISVQEVDGKRISIYY